MAGIAGILILHLILLIKLKFTAWPEMLLWPYLLVHNILPYKDIAIAHTPVLIGKLAMFYKLFGVGIIQLQVFTWVLIILSDILFYFVVNRLWDKKVALISTISYVILQIFYDGNGLWFDLLLVPIAILLYYLVRQKKYLLSGMVFALGFLTKQTFIWFLVPIILSNIGIKKFIYGNAVVIGVFTLGLLFSGLLSEFYNWAVNFGVFLLPRSQGQIQPPDFKNLLVSGLPFSIFLPFILTRKIKREGLFVWALFGCLGAYPRFEYFHFQPALPFLAMVIGIVFSQVKKDRFVKIFIGIYIFGSVYLFVNYLMRNWGEGVRFYEQDVIDITTYIKKNTMPGEKIFVMNWWDNVYPLSGTIPATDPWVPQLLWYQELPGIQDKEVDDLRNSKPGIILIRDYSESGLSSYKPMQVYNYIVENYKLKEKVDGIKVMVPN